MKSLLLALQSITGTLFDQTSNEEKYLAQSCCLEELELRQKMIQRGTAPSWVYR